MLSSLLRPENRTFGIAYQLALLEFAPIIAKMLETARSLAALPSSWTEMRLPIMELPSCPISFSVARTSSN